MQYFRCIIVCFLLTLLLSLSGCVAQSGQSGEQETDDTFSWLNMPMKDVVTGETITIDELQGTGKPVIIHTFAIWCPACTKQLKASSFFARANPDSYILVGLDIDPNEDDYAVKNHVEKNNFAGYYATVDKTTSKEIVKALGANNLVTLPQTIVVCNGKISILGDTLFTSAELKDKVDSLCG